MSHHLAHFEMLTLDASKLRRFYSHVFDWVFDTNNSFKYPVIHTGTPDVVGGITGTSLGKGIALYFFAPDIHSTLNLANLLGASTQIPVTAFDILRLTRFDDPCGNTVGLWDLQRPLTTTETRVPQHHLVGFEIACYDRFKAQAFYEALFGWQVQTTTGVILSGIGPLQARLLEESSHRLTPVFAAPNHREIAKRVQELGCSAAGPATEWVDGRILWRFRDISDNVFGVVGEP